MKNITLLDKEFRPLIEAEKIDLAISNMAASMNKDLDGEAPLFLSILNGSFM